MTRTADDLGDTRSMDGGKWSRDMPKILTVILHEIFGVNISEVFLSLNNNYEIQFLINLF